MKSILYIYITASLTIKENKMKTLKKAIVSFPKIAVTVYFAAMTMLAVTVI